MDVQEKKVRKKERLKEARRRVLFQNSCRWGLEQKTEDRIRSHCALDTSVLARATIMNQYENLDIRLRIDGRVEGYEVGKVNMWASRVIEEGDLGDGLEEKDDDEDGGDDYKYLRHSNTNSAKCPRGDLVKGAGGDGGMKGCVETCK